MRREVISTTPRLMPLETVIALAYSAGGMPPFPVAFNVGHANELVVWQPDGEVKTLRKKSPEEFARKLGLLL